MVTRFDPEYLWQRLHALSLAQGYCVGYSGGLDSHVLLHALSRLRPRLSGPIRAIHVDHALQPMSADWASHCARVCAALSVPLTLVRVDVRQASGESLEAAARQARYAAFEAALEPAEILLLGHHQDDQAETVLLRLFRGGGVQGLAAMAAERALGRGRLIRPLLDISRRLLVEYAERNDLKWIEDPSNQDTRFDRNFLRARVSPLLAERWPGLAAPLARAAANSRDAVTLLDELAALDLAAVADDALLKVDALASLSAPRQRNLLRYWIQRQGVEVPSRDRLEAGLAALLSAAQDRQPELRWPGGLIRRYRGRLVFTAAPARTMTLQPALPWDLLRPLELPHGQLAAIAVRGEGVRADLARTSVISVRFRVGGERCRPAGRAHRQVLKKLLQEAGIAPWERDRLPLVYADDQLIAVADLWVCEGYQAQPGEPGVKLVWSR